MERHEWNIRFRTAEEKSAVVRKIKIFAVTRGLTLAEALERLADLAGGPGANEWDTKKQSGTKADTQRTGANEHDIPREDVA